MPQLPEFTIQFFFLPGLFEGRAGYETYQKKKRKPARKQMQQNWKCQPYPHTYGLFSIPIILLTILAIWLFALGWTSTYINIISGGSSCLHT
jgi:hypothetical protein